MIGKRNSVLAGLALVLAVATSCSDGSGSGTPSAASAPAATSPGTGTAATVRAAPATPAAPTITLRGTVQTTYFVMADSPYAPTGCRTDNGTVTVDITSGSGELLDVAEATNDRADRSRNVRKGMLTLVCTSQYRVEVKREPAYRFGVTGTKATSGGHALATASELANGVAPVVYEVIRGY